MNTVSKTTEIYREERNNFNGKNIDKNSSLAKQKHAKKHENGKCTSILPPMIEKNHQNLLFTVQSSQEPCL